MKAQTQPILQVRNLVTRLGSKRGFGLAVNDVSFDLMPGETLGLVGESGSGKSMTCLSVLRLTPPVATQITGGQVIFDGEDLLQKSEAEMRGYRGRRISMILQDPMRALNPVLTIGDQLFECAQAEPQRAAHLHMGDAPLIGPLVERRRLQAEHGRGLGDVQEAIGHRFSRSSCARGIWCRMRFPSIAFSRTPASRAPTP